MKTTNIITLLAILLLALPIHPGNLNGYSSPSPLMMPEIQGGPDYFGYTYKDNTEPGLNFQWEEISATGKKINCFYAGYSCPFSIGFDFPFYGTSYSETYLNFHGYLSFGRGYGFVQGEYFPFPFISEPNNQIAVYSDSSVGSDGDAYYYQVLQNPTRLVVEYYHVAAPVDSKTFEVILYPNGDIVMQYLSQEYWEPEYLVGIENELGSDGLEYTGNLNGGLAIRFFYPTGIRILPMQPESFGRLGTFARPDLKLENMTGLTTAFSLELLPGNNWPLDIGNTTPIIPVNSSTPFDIKVFVPLTATVGSTDVATIRLTALSDPSIHTTYMLTTTATSENLAFVAVSGRQAEQYYYYVTKIDPQTYKQVGVIDLKPLGCLNPEHIATAPEGENTIWVSCWYSNQIFIIDRHTDNIIRVINNIPHPTGIAFTRDQNYALIGNYFDPQVSVVNRKTFAITSIPVLGPSNEIVVHPYLPLAYVTNTVLNGNRISIINTDTLSFTGSIDVGSVTIYLTLSYDGKYLFSGDYSNGSVSVISTQNNQIIHVIPLGYGYGGLEALKTNRSDDRLFINGGSWPRLTVINLKSYLVEKDFYLHLISDYESSALSCDGRELYISSFGEPTKGWPEVTIFSLENYTITAQVDLRDFNGDGFNDCYAYEVALCPPDDPFPKIQPSFWWEFVSPGETVVLSATITNQASSPVTDTLQIQAGSSNWPISLSANTTDVLDWKDTYTVNITFTVPAGAHLGDKSEFTITARSNNNPLLYKTIKVTASYSFPAAYFPLMMKDSFIH